MSKKIQLALLFLFLFLFRTFFGLSKTFYGTSDPECDALQTYLIGLKSFTTHTWPYFGPDKYEMDTGFHFQIFGAMEGLVTGAPFRLLAIPEAPFLFLNLLSLIVLGLLAWYASRQFSRLSFVFILLWISLLPWTLNQSTHVFNISYLLFGSVIFFLGFFEAIPEISISWLSPSWAFAFMGFGLFWDMQFHQSWVLLPPFLLGALVWRRMKGLKTFGKEFLGLFLGSIPTFDCLLPTYMAYPRLSATGGLAHSATGFHFDHFKQLFTILARYLSFACFEIPRYLGTGTTDRMNFLKEVPWIIPEALLLTVVGWIQPFVLLFFGAFKAGRVSPWNVLYMLTLSGGLMVWACFWFTPIDPAAHMYFILAPLVLFYSLAVWNALARVRWMPVLAFVCLAASLWLQTSLAIEHIQGNSLYQDRGRIVRALKQKDYHLLAERRPWVLY